MTRFRILHIARCLTLKNYFYLFIFYREKKKFLIYITFFFSLGLHLEQKVCVLGKSTMYSPLDYTHISKISLFFLGIAMAFRLDEGLYAGSQF